MPISSSTRGQKMVGIDSTITRPKVKPPKTLSVAAKKVWIKLVDSVPNDQFNDADFVILATYCETYAIMMQANWFVNFEGAVIHERGKSCKNPWFSVAQESASKIASLAIKLRLCPSARKKNEVTKEKVPTGTASTKLGSMIKR